MKMKSKKWLRAAVCCVFGSVMASLYTACSSDNDTVVPEPLVTRQARVTLLATHNGMGDNGYIDSSVEGVFAFAFQTGTPMQLLLPKDKAEAKQMYDLWIANNADRDSSVLVVGTEAYEDFVENTPVQLTGNGTRVLLFESCISAQPDGVSSIFINRYGAAYLCGAMSGLMDAFVIAAAPEYNTVEDAIHGFMDGYEAHHDEGKKAEFTYLASGETGFAMPDSVYHLLSRRMENFFVYNEMVFPLLGGSGLGVLRCMNDEESNLGLIIGMDVNQSAFSPRVPFSLIVKTGDVVHRYLDDWLAGREWPKHQTLGMGEGGCDVMLHPSFYTHNILRHSSYEDPETFVNRYNEFKEEAIRKEDGYENN
jgi:basic membrane lipoprotein Med (substrate-binding protein (PBP1-ABC) superfamily)